MTGLRTFAEIGIGAIYLIGAVFNSIWTLGHTEEFYGGFTEGAWLGPAQSLIRDLIVRNARILGFSLIGIGLLILALVLMGFVQNLFG